MVRGIHQVVLEVDDQDRALAFWTEKLGFELAQDAPYGDERWLEVRTPDGAVTVVPTLRHSERPTAPEGLPTSNIMFYCDDLTRTYEELQARGVEFPQPPVEQPFGWWSLFQDTEGNRFALTPRHGSRPLPKRGPRGLLVGMPARPAGSSGRRSSRAAPPRAASAAGRTPRFTP